MRGALLLLALLPLAPSARAAGPRDAAETLVSGLRPGDSALKARVFPDAFRYYALKAFAARDPAACAPLAAFEHTGEIDAADGAVACRRRFYALLVPYAFRAGEKDALATCRTGMPYNQLGADAGNVERICALLADSYARGAAKACSGDTGLKMSEEACLQRVGERHGDRSACARIKGMSGTSLRRELCDGMSAYGDALAAKDAARCGASEVFRLYMGGASALLDAYAGRVVAAAKTPTAAAVPQGPLYNEAGDGAREDAAAPKTVEEALARLDATNSDEPARTKPAPPALAELGRRLFFDKRLSLNRDLSCASCHSPEKGWSDGLPRARGAGGKLLARRTPSLLKVGYYDFFMWDGRAKTLEDQAYMPLQSPDEMGMKDLGELERRLKDDAGYRDAFAKAFGGEPTAKRTVEALVAFVRRVSDEQQESRFERFRRERKGLAEPERRGFLVFMGKGRCVACHLGLKLTYASFENSGVLDAPGSEDPGRYAIVPAPRAKGAFRTPTLFSAAETGPYMHNGSLKTLRDVVEFYDRGGDDKKNQSLAIKSLGLTESEKDDLVAFLGTLSRPAARITAPEDLK